MNAAEYLRIELREVLEGAAAAPDANWIRTEQDSAVGVLPNPVRLAASDSLISDVEVDYLAGHAHGDLHLANVLVPLPPGRLPVLRDIRLIDNPTYAEHAPLTRDPVTLMLSALLPIVGTLPDDQAERLMDYVVMPCGREPLTTGGRSGAAAGGWAGSSRVVAPGTYLLELLGGLEGKNGGQLTVPAGDADPDGMQLLLNHYRENPAGRELAVPGYPVLGAVMNTATRMAAETTTVTS